MTGKSWSHLLSLATLCGCCCVHCCLTYWCFDNVSILQLLYYSIITWMEDTGNIHYSKGQKQPFHSLHRRNMFNKFNTWPIYYIILYVMMYILCMQIYTPSTMILISTCVFPRIGAARQARSLVTNISPDRKAVGEDEEFLFPVWWDMWVSWRVRCCFLFVCWSLIFCLLIPFF